MEVGGVLAGLGVAGVREGDVYGGVNAAGIGGEDDDAAGEEDGFLDGVGNEEGGPALGVAEAEEFFVEAVAGDGVEGGEGLV